MLSLRLLLSLIGAGFIFVRSLPALGKSHGATTAF
ncbi:hypothetical protein [Dyadobacter frigoris]